ncbi:MAG: amidohydrolase family protein [Candidatus Limnocylindria bacterium]
MAVERPTLIRGGYLFDTERPFEVGDLLIEDGAIARAGPGIDAPGAEVIDASGRVVIPGLINAHTHSNQSIEKGLCDALPLDAWMVVASYGGAGATLAPDDLYLSTMVGALEMLETGTTSVLDCPRCDQRWFDEGMDRVMSAYADVGMRANVAAQYSDLDFFGSLPLHVIGEERPDKRTAAVPELLGRIEPYLERWSGKHPLLRPMLGPSSLPRCSVELFEASIALARKCGVALHTHLLSAKSQVPLASERYGGSTVEFLRRIGGLEPWTSFAHAIWLDDREIEILAASGTTVVHNPVSNLKLGAGIAPVPALLAAGVPVALGTDGASSNDSQNMFETLKTAAIVQRPAVTRERWPTAMQTLRMCWDGGARALQQRVGRLAPGYRADVVLLRTGELRIAPKDQVANQLVYAELGRSVDTVLVDGRAVVREGRVVSVDAARIRADAQRLVDGIWGSLAEREKRFAEVGPMLERLEREVRALPVGFSRFCG